MTIQGYDFVVVFMLVVLEGLLSADGPDPFSFDYDYCKGCGLCAAQCPRGAIVMAGCSEVVAQ